MVSPERVLEPVVTLRAAVPRDADLLWRWRGEWSVREHQPLHDLTAAQIRADIASQRISDLYRGRGEKFQWIVLADGRPCGWLTLVVTNWEHGLAEVGYALSSTHQGRGLMPSALAKLIDELFRQTALQRIEARCAVDNLASKRVLEKAGFTFEGRLRSFFTLRGKRVDNFLFSILRDDLAGLPDLPDGDERSR